MYRNLSSYSKEKQSQNKQVFTLIMMIGVIRSFLIQIKLLELQPFFQG